MKYNEWEKKLRKLPEQVKAQLAASATMKQPSDYVTQVTCNCTSDNFFELLADAVRAIQENYTRVTGVQLVPVMVDQNWFSYYDHKSAEIVAEGDTYDKLGIAAPKDCALLCKADGAISRVLVPSDI